MGQNPIPLVNIKIAGKWMFIPLKKVLIGIDPYPTKKLKVSLKREQDGNLETLWNSEEIVNCAFVFYVLFWIDFP